MAIAATTVALASCGSNDPNDGGGEPGKQLFVQKCGSCHVLAAADTKGTIGPNLDTAFAQSLEAGISRGTVESVVREQIEVPMGNVMPADLVEGEQADAVASYVADSIGATPKTEAAKPADATGKANAKNEVDNPPDPTGQLAYKFTKLQAKSGKVTLLATNESSVPHNIAIKDGPEGKVVSGGQTSTVSTSLKAGDYTFYCSVPGHEEAGMKGTLKIN